ncbi:MAG: hypothetical protein R2847_05260 [Bacteroidia bacterium]
MYNLVGISGAVTGSLSPLFAAILDAYIYDYSCFIYNRCRAF